MKLTIALCLSLTCFTLHAADKLDATLQKGLFEEEGNQNLEAAIQAYQSLVATHDNDRKTAATAIFRLGECYRKLGRTNEAIGQFQRILASFSDQSTLALLSRQNLVGLGAATVPASGERAGQGLEQSLAAQRNEAAAATAVYQRLQNLSPSELRRSLLTVVQDLPLSRLMEQAAQTEQKIAELSTRFSQEHPEITGQTKTLATVERQIGERIQGILQGLKLRADTAQQRLEILEAERRSPDGRLDPAVPRIAALDESSRAKMKEMLQQELQITEKLAAEQKKRIEVGTVAPGEDARLHRDVLGVKRQLLAVDGLTTPADLKQWREWLVQEIRLAEQAAEIEKKKLDAGRSTVAEVAPLQRDVLALKRELLEFDARPTGPSTAATSNPSVTTEEEEEIRKIKSIISNSPDLINTPAPADGSTPLHQAATKGQLIVARFLLDNGALVDQRTTGAGNTPAGQTALALACRAGHKAMAELLLSRGANPNSPSEYQDTPLHIAASKGFVSVAEVLIRNKARLDLRNKVGYTPLHSAVIVGQASMTTALLQAGADVNEPNEDGSTPLHTAVIPSRADVASILIERGAKINAVDKKQSTPLYTALSILRKNKTQPYRSEVIRLLLEKGASIEQAPAGSTILHEAIACNSPEIVKMVLERSPKIDALNSSELTPVQFAVIEGSSPEMIPLLVKAGADVRQRVSSTSSAGTRQRNSGAEMYVRDHPPLIVAIWRTDLPMAEALLENGADVNATVDDPVGSTAMMFALWTKSQEFWNLVLRYKPDLAAQTRNEGKTVLHLAVENAASAAGTLLKAGAPVNAVDFQGRTPLHVATYQNNTEVAELLLKNGADPNAMTLDGQRPLSIVRAKSQSPSGAIPRRVIKGGSEWPNASSPPNDMMSLLVKHGADELLLRRQTISVTRASRNYMDVYFRKGTNEFNRHTLYELFAMVYAGGSHLPFPELRQVTIERLQPDRSTRNITVDLAALASTDGACTNDIWLEWGDRVEIPEADHPLSQPWNGLDPLIVTRVAHCLQRNIEIVSKSGTNRYELRANRGDKLYRFTMDSFRLYSVLKNSGLLGNPSDWPIRVTRKRTDTGRPLVIEFTQGQESGVDLWLRDGDVVEILSK